MSSFQIPLWLTLTDIKVELKLSVYEYAEEYRDPQQNIDATETFAYELSGIGELSRIIEITPNNKIDIGVAGDARFSEVTVYLNATKEPAKKYRGQFFYLSSERGRMPEVEQPSLSLYLNVPEVPFNRFCDALISRKISNLSVGITVEAMEDNDVGAFGPPDRHDAVYIEGKDGFIDCNVKLTEIASITACQESKNDH